MNDCLDKPIHASFRKVGWIAWVAWVHGLCGTNSFLYRVDLMDLLDFGVGSQIFPEALVLNLARIDVGPKVDVGIKFYVRQNVHART